MIDRIKSRLHLKLSLIITGGALTLAAVASYFFYIVSYNNELSSNEHMAEQLVQTVGNTAAVSVYLGNDEMVSEVGVSLLLNDLITDVVIQNEEKIFFSSTNQSTLSGQKGWIEYPIYSPFSEDTKIGVILYLLNDALIQEQAKQAGLRNAATLLGHTLLVAILAMLCVYATLTMKLRKIAHLLHGIKPGQSRERLPQPSGHLHDELGLLVQDINALLDSADSVIRYKEELIVKLEKAVEEIRTLRGIIPICSHCKKIRNDEGVWNQMEMYVSQHSDAVFSHGVCPDCLKKYYDTLSSL